MSELYCILTLQLGYPPDYVLDNMQMFEVKAVMDYQHLKSKENWEQARLIAYLIALTNSTKKLSFKDIIEFPWEHENTKENRTISDRDIARLEQKAREFEQLFKP